MIEWTIFFSGDQLDERHLVDAEHSTNNSTPPPSGREFEKKL